MLPERHRRRLSMTSLIDVIFLLLLFFMLSSTFSKFGEIELTSAGVGGVAGHRPVLFLRLDQDRILLNGRALNPSGLASALQADAKMGERLVLVSLTKGVTAQQLVDVLTLLRGHPDLTAHVLG